MRVLLAGPDFEENLSIRYLASSLQAKRHEASLAVFNSADDVETVAEQAGEAEIVGLSVCFQSRAQEFLTLARRIKQLHPGKLIVAGGHYASCSAQPLLEHHPELDIIVIHEGEQTLQEIVAAAANLKEDLPKITGIAYREDDQVRFTPQRRTLDDLDTLPFPERSGRIHTIAGVPTSFLMGSRGCYENCAYCCITTLHNLAPGKKFRQRSVELIADEMVELYRERGTRQFVFHDDNFLVPSVAHNQTRIEGFDKAFKSRGMEDLALLIKCRPADANLDVLSRLKEMGLVRIFMGIESATEMGLLTLDRHQTVGQSIARFGDLRRTGCVGPVHDHDVQSGCEFEHAASGPGIHAQVCGEPAELLPCGDLRRHTVGETDDRAWASARRLSGAGIQHVRPGRGPGLHDLARSFLRPLLGQRQPDAEHDWTRSHDRGAEAIPRA